MKMQTAYQLMFFRRLLLIKPSIKDSCKIVPTVFSDSSRPWNSLTGERIFVTFDFLRGCNRDFRFLSICSSAEWKSRFQSRKNSNFMKILNQLVPNALKNRNRQAEFEKFLHDSLWMIQKNIMLSKSEHSLPYFIWASFSKFIKKWLL